jgi:predicted nucleotidyltransferase
MRRSRIALTYEQVAALRKWAAVNKRMIHSIRLFGSRTSKRWCACSDVDLAVEIRCGPFGENAFTAYMFEKERWQAELSAAVSAKVDFQWYHPSAENVQRYCRRGSVVLWPRRPIMALTSHSVLKCRVLRPPGPTGRLARKLHVVSMQRAR